MSVPISVSARPSLRAVVELLEQAKLPTEDLTQAHCQDFYFTGPASRPTGAVGLEIFGDVALLRSLPSTQIETVNSSAFLREQLASCNPSEKETNRK